MDTPTYRVEFFGQAWCYWGPRKLSRGIANTLHGLKYPNGPSCQHPVIAHTCRRMTITRRPQLQSRCSKWKMHALNLSILKGNRMISGIGLLIPRFSFKKTVFKNKNLCVSNPYHMTAIGCSFNTSNRFIYVK